MRINSGSAKGRRITAPPGHAVRPTSDRVRQATFNALVHRDAIDGVDVADLFAGSGALGLEALSRGAASATFVENDRTAQKFVRANVTALGFDASARVIASDVMRWSPAPQRFGLVFADPPYAFDSWPALLVRLRSIVTDDGMVVLESRDALDLGVDGSGFGWETVRQQRYGGTYVTLAVPADRDLGDPDVGEPDPVDPVPVDV